MMKKLLFFFLSFFLIACKAYKPNPKAKIGLRFLDEYIIPAEAVFQNTKIGGLSGIDFTGEGFLLLSDAKKSPRFYKVELRIQNKKIDTLIFKKLVELNEKESAFLKKNYLDPEAIRKQPESKKIVIASEGNIDRGKNPGIFTVNSNGDFLFAYKLPAYFHAGKKTGPRNNGVFEGLSNSLDSDGIWVVTELPLKTDGPKPKLLPTVSPVRITYFDKQTKKAEKQVVYLLEPIPKVPLLPFSINGVTELLQFSPQEFLILERGFSAGLGQKGNTVRLFLAEISKATNTLEMNSLDKKMSKIFPVKKQLLFDFKSVEKKLSKGFIDNIEGMTFGPTLKNGNRTLILISDNNFNSMGKQLNQVILMEVLLEKKE